MKPHTFVLLLAASFLLSPPAPASDSGIEEIHMNAATVDKALDGKQTYNFAIVSADEIIDQDGRHFSPGDASGYLVRTKPDKKAAYVFWVQDASAVPIVKRVIPAFGDYGATVFVIRETDKSDQSRAKALDETKTSNTPKTLVLVGSPNAHALSAADQPPNMAGRPARLRPGKLPRRVRYQFQPDSLVVAASDDVTRLLLGPPPIDCAAAFKSAMWLHPGAWKRLKNVPLLAGTKPLVSQVEMGSKVTKLEGRLVVNPEQFAAAIEETRHLIAADGGGTVRALTSQEMEAWWTFITLDIEEPTFVVETTGGKYRFIVHYADNHLGLIDELNALPVH